MIDNDHLYKNETLKNIKLDNGELILMIQRDESTIIPDGNTLILTNDTLVVVKH